MTEEVINISPIKLPVHKMDGSTSGEEVVLDPRLFGLPRNNHVLYLAVKAEMAHRRQGTHSTKTRSEVRGGGRKPFRQKGRGGARAGTNRSPIWVGGGITFGPKPHEYNFKLQKKVRRLARKVAFSVKALSGSIVLVEDFAFEAPKTKRISTFLKNFEAENKSVLLLVDGNQPNIVKSCRNIQRVEVRDGVNASTRDILKARKLIILRSALNTLVGGLDDA